MKTKYTRLCLAEREEISKGIYAFEKLAQIARRTGRSPSTITGRGGISSEDKEVVLFGFKGKRNSEKESVYFFYLT